MIVAIFFILGLAIGSFLNVVVYRVRTADSVTGRSYCPHCKKMIAWYDNIPLLSFIILKRRCRHCRKYISWRYPLVEFFTGVLFSGVAARFFSPGDSATWIITFYHLVSISLLAVILVYDFLYMEIPGIILWPAIGFAVGFNLILDWTSLNASGGLGILSERTYSGILAAFSAFVFFFLISSLSREKWMGIGDAYLVILLGLIIGWPGILLALFLSFLTGSVSGIILIALKKKTMKSQIPFAPFLILGTMITIFFYSPVVNWYFSLFGYW